MPTLSTRPSGPGEATHRTDGPHRGMCVLILDGHRLVSTALRTALRNTGLDAHELAVGDPDTIVAGAARYPAGVVLLGLALGTDARGQRIRLVELVTALARQGKPTLVFSENGERPAHHARASSDRFRQQPGAASTPPREAGRHHRLQAAHRSRGERRVRIQAQPPRREAGGTRAPRHAPRADGLALDLGRNIQIVGTAAAVHLILVVVWIFCVRHRWVREQADTHAERLFETMDHPELTPAGRPTN